MIAVSCPDWYLVLQVRSSKHEWMARGESLLQSARYELAGKAFQAAGNAVRAAHARSCWLYEMARALPDDSASAQKRQNLFREVRSSSSIRDGQGTLGINLTHCALELPGEDAIMHLVWQCNLRRSSDCTATDTIVKLSR